MDDGTSDAKRDPASAPPDDLTRSIEAILLTLDRPVPARRLAEGLGLIGPASAAEDAQPGAPEPPKPAPRRSRAARAEQADPVDRVHRAIAILNEQYAQTQRTFRIESVAGGYRLMTLPELAPALAAFHRTRASQRLSKPAIETLAVIAYKQPITRAHLEAVRGVACGEVLRSLLERRLISIVGRAEELGRPMLYGTSKEFLDAFGLSSTKDLPSITELQGAL
jgi:segregation and condensation protein B